MSLENQLFNLKFNAKQFERMSKKCEKNEKAQKLKLKQRKSNKYNQIFNKVEQVTSSKLSRAIEKGNMEGARIYAQNAIREKNQALNYLRLASRIDAVGSRVESAVRMKQVTKSMSGIVVGLDAAMKTMDMAKITQVMDQFEKQFEDLDVQAEYIENAMGQTTALTTPADQVDLLINQVAEEHGLEVSEKLGGAVPSHTAAVTEQDDLTERLAKLKAKT